MNPAIAYAKERVIGGMALSDCWSIRWMIAEMGLAVPLGAVFFVAGGRASGIWHIAMTDGSGWRRPWVKLGKRNMLS